MKLRSLILLAAAIVMAMAWTPSVRAAGPDVGVHGISSWFSTNVARSTNANSIRSAIGLDVAEPGATGTNLLTAADYKQARTNLWMAGRLNAQRLDPTPLLSVPQRAVVARIPVDQPTYWKAGTGTTLAAQSETTGSSVEVMALTTNNYQTLLITPSGAVTETSALYTNATYQNWSGMHFLVHCYVHDASNTVDLTSTNFTGINLTLTDSSGNSATVSMGSALAGEGATNGFYYHGSVPMFSSTNAPNWTFGSPPPDPTSIWKIAIKPQYNVANIAVPVRIGSLLVVRPPAIGKLAIVFDQTKDYGLNMAAQLAAYGMRATFAVQTNSSYNTWSESELVRVMNLGHGFALYGNDTVSTTNQTEWENTRVLPMKEYMLDLGLGDIQAWVYGGSGSAPYPLRLAKSARESYRNIMLSPIYSSETKAHSPYWLYNIVRYQEWSASAQYPSTVNSGSIGTSTYYVKSGGTVTYNGNTYAIGDSFRGVSGVTNYTGSGAVCARSTWQGAYDEARLTGGLVCVLIHAHLRGSDLDDFQLWLDEIVAPHVAAGYIELVSIPDLYRLARNGWNVPGAAVANTTDGTDVATKFNLLLGELRKRGVIAK